VKGLLKEFDFVIIDAPSIAESTLAETLAPSVDGSILVVVPNVTEVGEIVSARVKLTTRGGRLFGAIYNSSQESSDAERQS
jgi:Mrp family chromosome partitioning ATPase